MKALKINRELVRLQAMKKCPMIHGLSFLLLVLPILYPSIAFPDDSKAIPSLYQPLIHRLLQDGFDDQFLSNVLSDARAEFNPTALTIYLSSKEEPERYSQFLTPESILLAKKFLRQNINLLRKMENQFHVEKAVVVAILLIESRFGENIGKHRVIPTLATMALLNSPENLQKNYQILKEYDPDLTYEWLEIFAKRRADWAYHELKCFLNIIRYDKIDPLEVYGSYAGALGMAQFIPSSYLAFAVSKEGVGKWLLNKEEAIFSIGNYLKSHGWKRNLPIQRKRQIILYYNRSEPYVETVLDIAKKIKGSRLK